MNLILPLLLYDILSLSDSETYLDVLLLSYCCDKNTITIIVLHIKIILPFLITIWKLIRDYIQLNVILYHLIYCVFFFDKDGDKFRPNTFSWYTNGFTLVASLKLLSNASLSDLLSITDSVRKKRGEFDNCYFEM